MTGTTRSMSVDRRPGTSHASSTESMSAMSAIEQPALRSGRRTCWWSPVRMSADSAMKWTPQNTTNSASVWLGGDPGEAERVAPGIGPGHDLVALVVVAEDDHPGAERRLGGPDPRRSARPGRGRRVAVGERRLQADHVGYDPLGGAPVVAGGDSLVAHPRGCRPRSGRCRRKPGRRAASVLPVPDRSTGAVDADMASGTAHWRRGHPTSSRLHPRRPRVLPVRRRRRPGPLRGQGQVAAPRLNSYFQDPDRPGAPDGPDGRGRPTTSSGWWSGTEAEALLLEHNLIKQFQPRYNVRLKDDKSYPWLALTVNDEWPRPAVVRGRKRTGVRYFGPYPNVGAIRETLDLLLRSFPVRTCSDAKFRRHERLGRPCLLYHIERCSGPCVGAVDHEEYDQHGGRPDRLPRAGTPRRSRRTSRRPCGRHRPPSTSSGRGAAGQARGGPGGGRRPPDGARSSRGPRRAGLAEDELEAAVQVFHVRAGRVVGRLGPVRRQGRGPGRRPARRAAAGRHLRRRRLGRPPSGPGPDHAGRPRGGVRVPRRPAGRAGGGPGPHAGPEAGPAGDGGAQRRARPSSVTACSGPRTTTAGPGPSSRSSATWTCPSPPCASSATT